MHSVLEKLLYLPDGVATPDQKDAWGKLQARLPSLPVLNNIYAPCINCVLGGTGINLTNFTTYSYQQ